MQSLYSEKPWLRRYPVNVKHSIDCKQYANLLAFYEDCYQKYSNLSAFNSMDVSISFAENQSIVKNIATWLQPIFLPSQK